MAAIAESVEEEVEAKAISEEHVRTLQRVCFLSLLPDC